MRWAGPVTWASSARWGDFHPAFIWNLISYCKKLVLITWLLSGKFYIFNIDSRRLQQFPFAVYSIMNMITAFSILLQLHGILLSFTYIRFYLSGSTRRSHFEIEFGKNSKTYACALTKNHLGGLAHFSYEHAKFFKGVS